MQGVASDGAARQSCTPPQGTTDGARLGTGGGARDAWARGSPGHEALPRPLMNAFPPSLSGAVPLGALLSSCKSPEGASVCLAAAPDRLCAPRATGRGTQSRRPSASSLNPRPGRRGRDASCGHQAPDPRARHCRTRPMRHALALPPLSARARYSFLSRLRQRLRRRRRLRGRRGTRGRAGGGH